MYTISNNSICEIIQWTMLGLFIFTIILLIIFTVMRKNFDFIKNNTLKFILEIIAICILPSIAIFIFIYTRNISLIKCILIVNLFILKLALIHLLFETTGFYDYIFT